MSRAPQAIHPTIRWIKRYNHKKSNCEKVRSLLFPFMQQYRHRVYPMSSSVSIAATSILRSGSTQCICEKQYFCISRHRMTRVHGQRKGYVIKVKLSAPTVSTYNTSGNSQIKVKGYVAVQGDLTAGQPQGNSEVEFKQKLTARLSVAHQPATAQLSLTVRLYAHSSTQHHLATQEFRLKNFLRQS